MASSRRIKLSTGTASVFRGLGRLAVKNLVPPEMQADAGEVVAGIAEMLRDEVTIDVQVGSPAPRKRRRLAGGSR
ncbi:MAG: hypothetical protein WC969_15275 [Elusimicrobiota bacterium]|jgi:hypothetical protein